MYKYVSVFELSGKANRRDANLFFIELGNTFLKTWMKSMNAELDGAIKAIRWALPEQDRGNIKIETSKMLSKKAVEKLNDQVRWIMQSDSRFDQLLGNYELSELEFIPNKHWEIFKTVVTDRAKRHDKIGGLANL